jgi:hypothetical protein
VTVYLGGAAGTGADVSVLSLDGRELFRAPTAVGHVTWDAAAYARGTYVVQARLSDVTLRRTVLAGR